MACNRHWTSLLSHRYRDLQLRGIQSYVDLAILLHGSSPMREARHRPIRRNPRSSHMRTSHLPDNEHTVCQSLVSVTLASREVPVMVGLRLFLPESWTDDPTRMARARVPADRQAARTKPEIAIEEIDRVIASGTRFGCVLADAGYGSSGPFREALSARGLLWAVGLSRRQNVYPADIALSFPVAKTGNRRKYHVPDRPPISAELMLTGKKWKKITWRQGTKGGLTCRFAACRVRVADGHKHRMLDNRVQCMPGSEVWLVGERRSTGEQKYYVSNLPADTPIKMLAAAIKARWVCEQAHQQLKEELGLDHFEGRSWIGLHRHALMTMIAYAFLQSRRLKAAGRKKKNRGTTAATDHARNQKRDPQSLGTASTSTMPAL